MDLTPIHPLKRKNHLKTVEYRKYISVCNHEDISKLKIRIGIFFIHFIISLEKKNPELLSPKQEEEAKKEKQIKNK